MSVANIMETALEIIGTVVGLLYIWLEYKASIHLWIVSIIMPAIYLVVYYQAGLYADFGINIYYLVVAAYGWVLWKYGPKRDNTSDLDDSTTSPLPITHFPLKFMPYVSLIFGSCFLLIAWILIRFTDSNVPCMDSFTTALSIIGMWMLAKKYVEQWAVWIAVDIVSAGLYVYKDLYFTAALYALYAIIAVFGYKKWLEMMKNQ